MSHASKFHSLLLAHFLKKSRSCSPWDPLVRLTKDASGDFIIVLFPGTGGNPLPFRDVIDALSECSLFILMPRGWDGASPPHHDLQALVDEYVSSIMIAASGRTVHCVGWCFGSIVAFEVMRSLKKQGIDIGKLFAIEGFPSSFRLTSSKRQSTRTSFLRNIKSHFTSFLNRPIQHPISRIRGRLRTINRHKTIQHCFRLLRKNTSIPFHLREQFIAFHDDKIEANYSAAPFAVNLTLFWSTQDPDWSWLKGRQGPRLFDPLIAITNWNLLVHPKLKFIEIPGDHLSIMKSANAEIISRNICEELRA